MLKEKLENFFKGNGDNKKKTENLVFFLIILIVTVIVINVIWKDDKKEEDKTNSNSKKLADVTEKNYTEDTLETRLENILSNIVGVGNVDVLITYNETEEIIPVYNKNGKKSTTNETDSSGGTRVVEDNESSEEVVLENNKIITQKTVSPKIEGAIITATGASNSNVKAYIIQAVEAATGLPTHKIQVFEKRN